MNHYTKHVIAAVSLLGFATASAAPAKGLPQQYTQPDGTKVTLSLTGDEHFHYYLTEEGLVADLDANGCFRYVGNDGTLTAFEVGKGIPAQLDPTVSYNAYRDANARLRAIEPLTRSPRKGPKLGDSKWDNTDGHDLREVTVDGEFHVPVILVNFTDQKFSVSDDPKQTISDMLNQPGFSQSGATGSVFDYYHSVSNGQFSPVFDVYGPVNVSNRHAYYVSYLDETYEKDGKPLNVYGPGRLVQEAVEALDNEVDFSKYDANGDGKVDFVYIFHAGLGATTGGNSKNTIWPHAYTLTSCLGAPLTLDGKDVDRYAMSCELHGRELMGSGMFCHEFAHVLGLPDYYDTANNNGTQSKCFSPGSFSNMDAGNYNNDIHTPPTFSGYERYAMEWMKPVELNGAADITLLPLTARNFAYKVPTQRPQEYFMLEARAPHSYDTYIEGHGLAVWHIDFNLGIWDANEVNNNANHQRIDLIEADDQQTAATRDGDLFPGTAAVHEYLSSIQPAFLDWNKNALNIELQHIVAHPDGTVSFKATASSKADGFEIGTPAPAVEGVTADSAEIWWKHVDGANEYMISVYDTDSLEDGFYRSFVDGYLFKSLGKSNHAVIEGLKPGVNYGVTVYAISDKNASRNEMPLVLQAQGKEFGNAAPGVYVHTADDGATRLHWDEVADATHYAVTVATASNGESAETESADFIGQKVPEGWSCSGSFTSRSKYFGQEAPSFILERNDSYLSTPRFDKEIKSVSFWYKLSFVDEGLGLDVYGTDVAGRTSWLKRIGEFTTKGEVMTIDIPAGFYELKLVPKYSVTGLKIYMDDVNVLLASESIYTPVSGYDAKKVDDNSLILTGLEADKEYVAFVQPYKDAEAGLKSAAKTFVPALATSGVTGLEVDSDGFAVRVEGDEIIANGDNLFSVYTADGRVAVVNAKGSCRISASGLYIVRSGNKAVKVFVK